MGVIVARLRLAPTRETMLLSRAPFFQDRLVHTITTQVPVLVLVVAGWA
jgi:hypothetical protein